MINKLINLLILLCFSDIVICQDHSDKVYISYGYSTIPLHVERTNRTRRMIFPSFEGGYRTGNKLLFMATYMTNDINLNNKTLEERNQYKEIPVLKSYDEAQGYIGKIQSLPHFYSYCFAGINYEYWGSKFCKINTGIQIGYRFGEYFILTSVVENPSRPNGFESHSTLLSSDSPGIRLSISPKIVFANLVFINISIGSFFFFNWPELQPFGNIQFGLAF